MSTGNLVRHNPFRIHGHENKNIISEGSFGAVLARAGVGKTALLVQLALSTLFRSKNVLHVSLDDPVNKVDLWYQEVYRHLAKSYKFKQTGQFWESLLPHRFIMTFKTDGFSVPKLEERLTELAQQKIFSPHMMIIDGFPLEESSREDLVRLKACAEKFSTRVWFAVRTHRHKKPGPDGMPSPFSHVADLFEIVFQLQPEDKEIHVRVLKGEDAAPGHSPLRLDPATMLVKDNG
jgi:hypothetical protein